MLDSLVKLTAPAAVVIVALMANNFQEELSARSTLNQREQAESSLRAEMFGSLIDPLIRFSSARGEGGDSDTEIEALLVGLLALNFHEHFELKPLMQYAYARLAEEDAKNSLTSIAARIKDRQVALLDVEDDGDKGRSVYRFFIKNIEGGETLLFESYFGVDDNDAGASEIEIVDSDKDTEKYIPVTSPDGESTIHVTFHGFKYKKQTVEVQYFDATSTTDPKFSTFTLSIFDFPFTDNTLMSSGNRFSFYISDVYQDDDGKNIMEIKLRWFPKNYFLPRERPTDSMIGDYISRLSR